VKSKETFSTTMDIHRLLEQNFLNSLEMFVCVIGYFYNNDECTFMMFTSLRTNLTDFTGSLLCCQNMYWCFCCVYDDLFDVHMYTRVLWIVAYKGFRTPCTMRLQGRPLLNTSTIDRNT